MFKSTPSFLLRWDHVAHHSELVAREIGGMMTLVGVGSVLRVTGSVDPCRAVALTGRLGNQKVLVTGGKLVRVPEGSVVCVSSGSARYWVLTAPTNVELEFGVVKVCFLGCYAWDVDTGEKAVFSADLDRVGRDPSHEAVSIRALVSVLDQMGEGLASSPEWSAPEGGVGESLAGGDQDEVQSTGSTLSIRCLVASMGESLTVASSRIEGLESLLETLAQEKGEEKEMLRRALSTRTKSLRGGLWVEESTPSKMAMEEEQRASGIAELERAMSLGRVKGAVALVGGGFSFPFPNLNSGGKSPPRKVSRLWKVKEMGIDPVFGPGKEVPGESKVQEGVVGTVQGEAVKSVGYSPSSPGVESDENLI